MTNVVIIRCQKTPEVGIRHIPAYAYIPPIDPWNQSKIWGAWARFGGGPVPPRPQPKTATAHYTCVDGGDDYHDPSSFIILHNKPGKQKIHRNRANYSIHARLMRI